MLVLSSAGAGAPAPVRARHRASVRHRVSTRMIAATCRRRQRFSRAFFATSRDDGNADSQLRRGAFPRLQELGARGHACVRRHALHGPRRQGQLAAVVMRSVACRAPREVLEVPADGTAEEARRGVVRDGGGLGRGVGAEPLAFPRVGDSDLRHPLPPPPPAHALVPAPPLRSSVRHPAHRAVWLHVLSPDLGGRTSLSWRAFLYVCEGEVSAGEGLTTPDG
jgi:hypothetical protein